jgi:hypothetical protein
MSTTAILGILLTMLFAACTSAAPPQDKATEETGPDIRGTITRIAEKEPERPGPRILVEGQKEPDTHWDQAWIQITPDTRILARQGQETRPAKAADLAVGQTVEARFTGPVAKSLPLQAEAKEIVILGESSP